MNNYQIFKNFQKHIPLSNSEKEYLMSLIKIKTISKKEFILKQGQICKKIYFVEFGSLRAFNIDAKGKETTIMFAVKDWWITDMNCFVNKTPALLSIEALENSMVMELDFNLLEELYQKLPKFERFFRILFQNAYIREQQRALYNSSFTTEERYIQFVEKYPTVFKKVTQKQIASYLGVTPEFLSSVKNSTLKLS